VSSPSPSTRPRILVADDTTAERDRARLALEQAGYEVLAVEDGQRAIERFARDRPDLVLLDVVMPRLSGLDACRILKAQARGTYLPIILVSSKNSVGARVEGLRCGADDYLGKPYDDEELRARVEALLRIRAAMAGTSQAPPVEEAPSGAPDFRRRLEEEFDRAQRYSDPLACLRIETEGSPGPEAAGALHDAVASCVRKIDLVHRVAPQTYLIVLPNTHFPGALSVAERIVRRGRNLPGLDAPVPVSVGIAFFPSRDVRSCDDLLRVSEQALERARAEGGGSICLFQHEGYLYRPEDETPSLDSTS